MGRKDFSPRPRSCNTNRSDPNWFTNGLCPLDCSFLSYGSSLHKSLGSNSDPNSSRYGCLVRYPPTVSGTLQDNSGICGRSNGQEYFRIGVCIWQDHWVQGRNDDVCRSSDIGSRSGEFPVCMAVWTIFI